jgi:hypothetical protein
MLLFHPPPSHNLPFALLVSYVLAISVSQIFKPKTKTLEPNQINSEMLSLTLEEYNIQPMGYN